VRAYPSNDPRPAPASSPGLLALQREVTAEPTPQLEAQRALLAGIPPALRHLARARLALASAELRRREAMVRHG